MNSRVFLLSMGCLVLAACDNYSTVVPPAPNAAPTISAIADQSTSANESSSPIAFSVSDENVAGLSYALMSDNQQVLPDSGIDLGGSGTSRSVTITPAADETGDAFVTIIITDTGGLSASSTFLVTITPQQQSMQQYSRAEFANPADGDPALINAIEFTQDADGDDFADLLGN